MIGPAAIEPNPRQSRFAVFARDIKLSHTVFALPFALLSAFIAAGGFPRAGQFALILACMVSARTVAMAANRLLDARLDALNPRTATRAIPSGRLSARFYVGVLVACSACFIAAAAMFWPLYRNPWPLYLAVPVLAFLAGYPLLKRFTTACHYYLGAALGLAPVAAWIAIRGDVAASPLVLGAGVMLWTAGFDIIYATLDIDVDRRTGLFSMPARWGLRGALWISRASHALAAACLAVTGILADRLGAIYLAAVGLAAALLVVEHLLVRENDLSRVNTAFFTINGIVSVLVGTAGIVDVLL